MEDVTNTGGEGESIPLGEWEIPGEEAQLVWLGTESRTSALRQ